MASLIANGTATADSAEFTLAAGESTTLNLLAAGGNPNAVAGIYIKDSAGTFALVGNIGGGDLAVKVLSGIGTYKVTRFASAVAFGVDRN